MKRGAWVIVGVLLAAVFTQGCVLNSDKVRTPSGINVEFLRYGEGDFPSFDDILHFHLTYSDHTGRAVYDSRKRRQPYKIRNLDLLRDTLSVLGETLRMCKVGDSITFKVPYTRYYPEVLKKPCPEAFKFEYMTYHASLFLATTLDNIQEKRRQIYQAETAEVNKVDSLHRAKQTKIDSTILVKYFNENGLKPQRTENGAYFIIKKKGSGTKTKHGSTVTVDYVGSLLDGTEFYSSYKMSDPMSFVLGFREVIQGWDETIALMRQGTKATLYVPSTMAYGNKSSGPVVGPNSILVYEIEVVEVK